MVVQCEVTLQVTVRHVGPPPNWKTLGGIPEKDEDYPVKEKDGSAYWYKMMYTPDYGRFEDIPKDYNVKVRNISLYCCSQYRGEMCSLGNDNSFY